MSAAEAIVYAAPSPTTPAAGDALPGVRTEHWRPRGGRLVPPGALSARHLAWWAVHRLGLFANGDYGAVVLWRDGRPVHRSILFPPYFAFPFMRPDDVQIGLTYTAPEARGQGLASHAIREALRLLGRPGRTFWYLTEPSNHASRRAAERAGLERVGTARHVARLGVHALGGWELVPDAATATRP